MYKVSALQFYGYDLATSQASYIMSIAQFCYRKRCSSEMLKILTVNIYQPRISK